jgi:hypothetical protein
MPEATPVQEVAATTEALTTPGPTEEVATEEVQEVEGEELEPEEVEQPSGEPKSVPYRRFTEVYGRMRELERTLVDLAKHPEPATRELAPEPEPDYDNMTPTQFAKAMREQMRKDAEAIVKSNVAPMGESVARDRAVRDIEATQKEFPDFWSYQDAMLPIAKTHPTLTAREVYLIASGDKGAAKKAVLTRMNDKVKAKARAKVETRSSGKESVVEKTEYKSIKEAALANAKKLGLM